MSAGQPTIFVWNACVVWDIALLKTLKDSTKCSDEFVAGFQTNINDQHISEFEGFPNSLLWAKRIENEGIRQHEIYANTALWASQRQSNVRKNHCNTGFSTPTVQDSQHHEQEPWSNSRRRGKPQAEANDLPNNTLPYKCCCFLIAR